MVCYSVTYGYNGQPLIAWKNLMFGRVLQATRLSTGMQLSVLVTNCSANR